MPGRVPAGQNIGLPRRVGLRLFYPGAPLVANRLLGTKYMNKLNSLTMRKERGYSGASTLIFS